MDVLKRGTAVYQPSPDSGDDESFEMRVQRKLSDADLPGFAVECSAEECDIAGAFIEDAISAAEALDSAEGLDFSTVRGDL